MLNNVVLVYNGHGLGETRWKGWAWKWVRVRPVKEKKGTKISNLIINGLKLIML